MTTCQQGCPEGGRCAQVWLYVLIISNFLNVKELINI